MSRGEPDIQTALGPVAPDALGHTLAHEHVVVTSPEVWRSWTTLLGPREALVAAASRRLAEAREAFGLQTIVDPTTPDLGRDVSFVAEVSRRSGVNVIVATGCYVRPPVSYVAQGADALAEHFVEEIEVGIEGTGIRAGVIKVGHDHGVDGPGQTVLRAAAHAQLATGVPIIAHGTAGDRVGHTQAALLEALGVPPRAVCLAHLHDTGADDYLEELGRRGYWLGLDRFPGGFMVGPKPAERIEQLARLLAGGLGGQLCVSHDWSVRTTMLSPAREDVYRGEYNPHGYGYLHDVVRPALVERGVDAGAVDRLFTDNPRRFLAGSRPAGAGEHGAR